MTNFNFGGMDVVLLLGVIAGCHCSVLWCGEGDDQFVDVVPLQGAIVVCYGGKGGLWEWTWCHCWVPISISYLRPIFRATNFTHTPKKTTMNLSGASCRRYTLPSALIR